MAQMVIAQIMAGIYLSLPLYPDEGLIFVVNGNDVIRFTNVNLCKLSVVLESVH